MHHRIRKIRNVRRSRRLRWLHSFRSDDRGIQLVELAIVLPVIFLLFAATAEFGRYFYEYTTLAKAARIGARYLSANAVKSSYDATARNLVVYGNEAGTGSPILTDLTTTNVVITRQGGVTAIPETVTVQISGFKHQPVFDLGAMLNNPSLSLNVDVKPSVTMRFLLTQPPL